MDKNQPFFDPYNFGNGPLFNPLIDNTNVPNEQNLNSYYESQYLYYRYLTQMMDYKLRCKEFEIKNKEKKDT